MTRFWLSGGLIVVMIGLGLIHVGLAVAFFGALMVFLGVCDVMEEVESEAE